MPRLADRYRTLLLCYPRAYRRERGEEIVNTLLEGAPAGRSRPTFGEVVNLLGHGLRCRLGRPASRSVVGWAALTALVCGLFSAALASRAAWETARPLPDVGEAAEIFATVLPAYHLTGGISRSPAMFVVYGSPLSLANVDDLLFGDGGEYGFGLTSGGAVGPVPGDWRHNVETARQRLYATGWRVADPVTSDAVVCGDARCVSTRLPQQTLLTARRGDTIIEINVYSESTFDTTSMSVALERATPWAVYPASVAGGLFGAFLGWLLFGWASRRTEARHALVRTAALLLYAAVMFLWGAPMVVAAPLVLAQHLHEEHPRWPPLWEWLGQPVFSLPFLLGCAAAVLVLVIAALPGRATIGRATIGRATIERATY